MRALFFLPAVVFALTACGSAAPDSTQHQANLIDLQASTGAQSDYAFRYGVIHSDPGKENLWVITIMVYPNPLNGDSRPGVEQHQVAINSGDSWSVGDDIAVTRYDMTEFTVDGFDPLQRAGYTLTAISDDLGLFHPGDQVDCLLDKTTTIDASGGSPYDRYLKWVKAESRAEPAPGMFWNGGGAFSLKLCPESERIQTVGQFSWCAPNCEQPATLLPQYQLNQYPLCQY